MKVIRGVAALLVLLGGLLALPYLLTVLTSALWPIVGSVATTSTLAGVDPVLIVLALLLLGGWTGWLVFGVSVVAELVTLVSRHRYALRLPALNSIQRLAGGLLMSVVAMLTTTQASSADPAPSVVAVAAPLAGDDHRHELVAEPGSTTVVDPDTSSTVRAKAPDREVDHAHLVEPGDDLWSLAQHYYGRGADWRKIARANPDRLTGGPDRLQPGWRLIIPDVRTGAAEPRDEPAERTVVVAENDTLSGIAEKYYGAQRRWPIIWNANRDRLDDPDELDTGMRLVVPYRPKYEDTPSRHRSDPDRDDDRPQPEARPEGGAPDRPRTSQPVPTAARAAPTPQRETGASQHPPSSGDSCVDGVPAGPHPSAEAPTDHASPADPVPADPVPADPAGARPPAPDPPPAPSTAPDPAVLAAGIGSAGALLAAALITGLALRRRQQLQLRPVGRRILHPVAAVQRVETALGRRARPISLRTLDLATRAISAHCHRTATLLPALTVATVTDEQLQLRWSGHAIEPPDGFQVEGDRWLLDAADADRLKAVPGLSEAVRPYPALVTLGTDAESRPVVADLETLGLLHLEADDPQLVEGVLAAMALELSFSPWAEEMILTLVGSFRSLPEALGRHNVSATDDVDALLERLESRAVMQRAELATERPGQHRVDPDLADPWAPEIILINTVLEEDHELRLRRLLTATPRATMAAVLPSCERSDDRAGIAASAGWTLRLDGRGTGVLEPIGVQLTPQLLPPSTVAAVVDVLHVTGSERTTRAPWWSDGDALDDPDPPPDNVRHLDAGQLRRSSSWGRPRGNAQGTEGGQQEMITAGGNGAADAALHPTLLLLGSVELVGATGSPPPRAAKQCLEYCGWLLEHPGATAQAMASALVVAEGTRRSNMSRLRTWLGSDADGTPYLPDAYSGKIRLQDAVSSDWQRLQILTAPGIDRSSTAALRAALELVRGAPLADAAPGQWYWAEELRTDMISAVRDLGVELANRALDDHDIDLARWAASRALAAAPGDELLMVVRIRTEHRAGHRSEVERLTLHIAAQARQLGVDLAPETVTVLQQVLEGRARARMA